jgi:hypothetical protein
MATEDEKLQMALAAFKCSSRTPGQALSPFEFIDIAAKNFWRNLDVLDGVKAGFAKGFFDDGPNYGIQLTSAGFAAIAALNETVQTETTALSSNGNDSEQHSWQQHYHVLFERLITNFRGVRT